jgi:hypothetical protein
MYGKDIPTEDHFTFSPGAFPDGQPKTNYTPTGDGTVNLQSLEALKRLPVPSNMTVTHRSFSGVDHIGILNEPRVIDYIVSLGLKPRDKFVDGG